MSEANTRVRPRVTGGPDAGCRESLEALVNSVAGVPAHLAAALAVPLPAPPPKLSRVVTTGIGASEPPARLLASLLVAGGIAARFCPTLAFSDPARDGAPRGDLLVSFSQGLSPNAQLATGAAHGFVARWLVTSVGPDAPSADKRALRARLEARGVTAICLPPAEEPAWLVRIAGPTVAALGALRIAAHVLGDSLLTGAANAAPEAYRQGCLARPVPSVFDAFSGTEGARVLPEHALALITLAAPLEGGLAQRCKLMETLLVAEPPVWDVLQFAHGPLQAYYAAPLTLLVLDGPEDDELVRRLTATLAPERHDVVRLTAPRAGVLALFSHAAAVDALLVATLRERPRNLSEWPAQRCDGPLYDLGKCP